VAHKPLKGGFNSYFIASCCLFQKRLLITSPGINASAFLIAPLVFTRLVRRFSLNRLLPLSYLGVLFSALLMFLPVFPQPYRLAIPMWLLTFFFAFGRPPENNLILEQIDTDVGAALSLMVFIFFMMGACSMWLISLGWQDKLQVLSIMGIISATIKLLGWFFINRRFRIKMA
jgi:DHA1 family bicyclomycin/chloramphenicol resistance-like MFS transporter